MITLDLTQLLIIVGLFVVFQIIFGYTCYRRGWIEGYIVSLCDTLKKYHIIGER